MSEKQKAEMGKAESRREFRLVVRLDVKEELALIVGWLDHTAADARDEKRKLRLQLARELIISAMEEVA